MTTYDWIVVGNGIAGAALSYELQKVGLSVLLLEQSVSPQNATRYSYGGIAYWSGTTDLMRQLCREGIEIQRQLSTELESDTHFQERDLLLTVAVDRDPVRAAAAYQQVETPPTILDAATACEVEPLLNRSVISGALRLPHGQVSSEAAKAAYNQAFLRLGGKIHIASVTAWLQQDQQIQGVITPEATYLAENIAVCAGAMTRTLLRSAGLPVRLYFTQAELIETVPVEIKLRSIVMPAELQRFAMEAQAGAAEKEALWDQPSQEIMPAILDVGAVQLHDGRLRLGQVSRTLTDLEANINAAESEQSLRQAIGTLLPALQQIPGQWCCCRVAFCCDRLPLVGAVPGAAGIHVFAGFSNPFAILPPLARRFAQFAAGYLDAIPPQLSPSRFTTLVSSK